MSPERMHPEILCRLRTDLKPAGPIPLLPVEPAVIPLAVEDQPLDLSKTVWPPMLPLDLSTKGTSRVSRPDMAVSAAAFTNSQPRPPALGSRPLPQKVSPVRPVQRQPVAQPAPSDRVAAATKAGFRDGIMLHSVWSQKVRSAFGKLQLSKGLGRQDMPTPLRRGSSQSPAVPRCRKPTETANVVLSVAACPVVDAEMLGSQRISRLMGRLAHRLGRTVPAASKRRSSWGKAQTPAGAQRSTESEGTFQGRYTAARRRIRGLRPPLAEVRPLSACPRPYAPDGQERASNSVGVAVVEPSKYSPALAVADFGTSKQIGQGQLSAQLGGRLGARTYNVSRVVTRTSTHATPTLSHDVITIIDTSPVLATTKSSSGRGVLAALKPDKAKHPLGSSVMDVSQEPPALSPPKLHIVTSPSVAGSSVCNTGATAQMPQLSPHADVIAAGPTDSGPAVRRSLSPPALLVCGSVNEPFPATNSCRADTPHTTSSFDKSKAAVDRRTLAAANPTMDLAVFMPTKPFSIDLFSRCVDTWAQDIARPSKAGANVRHRSTFDIGRTTYYKNTILCQQTPATTSQTERRVGGRYPVATTPSSRHAGGAATHEMCRRYHRDCRLPASIIGSLPTLPDGASERRSPKMARTVASVKRAATINVQAASAGPSPAKMGRSCVRKLLPSSENNVNGNVSPKMARTVASVKQGLRAGHSSNPASSGLYAHKHSSVIGQLTSSESPEQELGSHPRVSTGTDHSDPELNCSSARFGYARKAFGSMETDSFARHVQNAETSPRKGSGIKRVDVSPRREPVVNSYTNSARSGKSPPRSRSGEKPKTVVPTKSDNNRRLTSAKLLTNAEFPELDSQAAEKAVVALLPLPSIAQNQEPADSGPVSKKGRLSPRDDRIHVSVSDKQCPLSSVVVTITKDGKVNHDDTVTPTATSQHGSNITPAVVPTSTITLRHSYPVVKLERVEAGPGHTMTWKCVTKRSPGAEQRRSAVRTSTRSSAGKTTGSFATPKRDRNSVSCTDSSGSSGGVSVRSRVRRPPTDRRISSSSSSSSCGGQHRKRRSLLDELSNTDGYIADETRRRGGVDLFADPSTLSREERALQVRDSLFATH